MAAGADRGDPAGSVAGMSAPASGPLAGIRIVELAGIGPGPFAGMLLSDMGADVLRIDRAASVTGKPTNENIVILERGRRSVGVDLKRPEGVECVLRLVERADALIEGYRPGVVERLGIGPDACLARNPRLVYGRMTGWGQDGPLARAAGHDINYIALAGSLFHFGPADQKPTPPLNLVGDFGGGAMFLAFGIVCGLVEARVSGQGQVVDAAMVDGAATLMSMMWGLLAQGRWTEARGSNLLDGGAPYYDAYETADGGFVSLGAIEAKFYATFLELTGLVDEGLPDRDDVANWPKLRARFEELFRSRTREEWCELLEGSEACFAPVLAMSEAARHPHLAARGTIVELDGLRQPAPAPRFSRTPGGVARPAPVPGQDTDAALVDWGFTVDEVAALHVAGAIRERPGLTAAGSCCGGAGACRLPTLRSQPEAVGLVGISSEHPRPVWDQT